MATIQELHSVCSAMGELALPRAFLERRLDKFVSWNSRFLKALRISEEEIQSARGSEILSIQGEGTEINGGVRMTPCSSVSLTRGQPGVRGNVITVEGALSFVMVDVSTPEKAPFETGRLQGIQEEQNRGDRFLYEKVSPPLMAAAFLVEDLVKELEAIQPGTGKKALEIRNHLATAFDEMHLLFGPESVV